MTRAASTASEGRDDLAQEFVQAIQAVRTEKRIFRVPIMGTAPLLVGHKLPWDIGGKYWEEQPLHIRERQLKCITPAQADLLRALRQPVPADGEELAAISEVYLRGHWMPDYRPGFIARGFTESCAQAAIHHKGQARNAFTGAKARRGIEILGDEMAPEVVAISGTWDIFECGARNSGRTASPRWTRRLRCATGWRAVLRVQYDPDIQLQDVVQLLVWAGELGIGQWRRSAPKGGTYGTWIPVLEDA